MTFWKGICLVAPAGLDSMPFNGKFESSTSSPKCPQTYFISSFPFYIPFLRKWYPVPQSQLNQEPLGQLRVLVSWAPSPLSLPQQWQFVLLPCWFPNVLQEPLVPQDYLSCLHLGFHCPLLEGGAGFLVFPSAASEKPVQSGPSAQQPRWVSESHTWPSHTPAILSFYNHPQCFQYNSLNSFAQSLESVAIWALFCLIFNLFLLLSILHTLWNTAY